MEAFLSWNHWGSRGPTCGLGSSCRAGRCFCLKCDSGVLRDPWTLPTGLEAAPNTESQHASVGDSGEVSSHPLPECSWCLREGHSTQRRPHGGQNLCGCKVALPWVSRQLSLGSPVLVPRVWERTGDRAASGRSLALCAGAVPGAAQSQGRVSLGPTILWPRVPECAHEGLGDSV